MNDKSNASLGPSSSFLTDPEAQAAAWSSGEPAEDAFKPNGAPRPGFAGDGAPHSGAASSWALFEAFALRWPWMLLSGVAFAAFGLWIGLQHWVSTYTAPVQLIRYDSPNATEVFGYRVASAQTFASLLRAPQIFQRTAAQASPPRSAEALARAVRIMPERNNEIVVVAVTDRSPQAAVDLANLFAREAIRYTQELQAQSAAEVNNFVTQQLARVEAEMLPIKLESRSLPAVVIGPALRPRPSVLMEKFQEARDELVELLAQFTEAHPKVHAQRAKLAAIQSQLEQPTADSSGPVVAGSTNPAASGSATTPDSGATGPSDPEIVRSKLQVLESARLTLLGRQNAAQSFGANPPGYCRLLAPATQRDVVAHDRTLKVIFLTSFAGLLGFLFVGALALGAEIFDPRLKTTADVARVTRLPVVATAGDLSRLNETQLRNWAFRTWTSIQGRLSPSPNLGLVLGVTSAGPGEGRSTWVSLLADAANQRGFRVLTIATQPSAPSDTTTEYEDNTASVEANVTPEMTNGGSVENNFDPSSTTALATNVLASPAEVSQRLTDPNLQPLVHIPLPGWVWNLERRKQWQAALRHWSQIDNIVILVELPPAEVPEAVLLAENLPNLIWLADSGKVTAGEALERLETLRHARCRLAGAVLNHAPRSAVRSRFLRWVGCLLLLGGLNAGRVQAGAGVPPGTDLPSFSTNGAQSFSVSPSSRRATWQQRLTLGPGDLLNLSLFGQPELSRAQVPLGPDGRISFLEAQDIAAAGLTIDELRAKLDEELGKYRRSPRSIVTPAAFHSKKYFVLGCVVQKGVFTLDRPVSVIEAVARARGLETGLSDRTTVELTDLSRSFLARAGKRVPVNFEKLFQDGDLTQNVAIEPDDYLYFPVSNLKEIYVLGEVNLPGPANFNPGLSALAAIATRGGFTDRAWKGKVLVVRGSLNHPETLVVDALSVLAATAPDLALQPKDIVYVNARPWIRAEELLDAAMAAFAQSAVIVAAGEYITPFLE